MPVLGNPKHERFSQELAKGKTADEAYQLAGYAENRGNAARLKANESIERRVGEILERSAIRAEVSLASITEDLARIARKAEDLAEASGLAVARAAKVDIAKINGLFADKLEVNASDELAQRLAGARKRAG
jgi:phage terminase small subunit